MFQKAIGEKCHGLLRSKIPTGQRGWSNPRVLQEAVTTWHWLQLECPKQLPFGDGLYS